VTTYNPTLVEQLVKELLDDEARMRFATSEAWRNRSVASQLRAAAEEIERLNHEFCAIRESAKSLHLSPAELVARFVHVEAEFDKMEAERDALRAEVETLRNRVLVPLTEQQIVAALHEGRAEAMAATGDNAWASIVGREHAARIEAIRAKAERDSFHDSLDICHGECKTLREELTAAEDRCDTIETARDAARAEADRWKRIADAWKQVLDAVEYKRMRPVFEAALAWHEWSRIEGRIHDAPTNALVSAIDAAITKQEIR
jgi:chromosome segregation ATPase